jgi:uncharacterized UBP type Zn finger protein
MRDRLADAVRRIVFQRSFERRGCEHLAAVGDLEPENSICQSCVDAGERPVKLRMCLTCGTVGCCDSSRLQHARAHFEATGHPVMRSIEPGETWAWCYPDQTYVGTRETAA